MRCPLLAIGWSAARGGDKTFPADCLKEECAWYDSIIQQCLIYALHTDFAAIHSRLSDITKELTLGGHK